MTWRCNNCRQKVRDKKSYTHGKKSGATHSKICGCGIDKFKITVKKKKKW